MDRTEFRQWYLEHRAAFPGIDAWLGRMAKADAGTDAVKGVDVLRQWERALGDITFDEACAATQAMLRGDVEEPRSFEGHPRAIRRHAYESRGQHLREVSASRRFIVDNEETVRCPRCLDLGYIEVYRRETVRAWRQGKEYPPHREAYPYVVSVLCTCGQKQAEWMKKRCRVYDAMSDVIPGATDDEPHFHPLTCAEKCDQLREIVASAQAGEAFDPDVWQA